MKKKIIQALITTVVVSSFTVTPVFADPGDDVRSLEIQKSEMENRAADVQSQLVDLLVSYEALQKDIENQQVRIDQAQTDLEAAEAKEKKQYEDMKLRIKYIYEQGDTSYFESLITAESYSELVSKAEYVQNVHNYDREQLKEYVETKEQVASLKTELEAGQADMKQMAADLSSQQTNMENELNTMRSQIADFDSQLKAAKAQAAIKLNELTEATETMVASAETGNAGSTGTSKPSSAGTTSNTTGETTSKPSTSNTTTGTTSKPSTSNTTTGTASNTTTGTASNTTTGTTDKPSGVTSGSTTTSKPSNASLGQQIANKACQYIGNPYVYGGNSLTNGIDCSGFVHQIHAQFGISTPRSSEAIQSSGKPVSYSDMLPGDVICYSGHVAIYIGNNTIVHASNSNPYPAGGIKTTSPANYRTILAIRRYW